MKSNFKTRFWKLARWFAALFIIMLLARLLYGYLVTETVRSGDDGRDYFTSIDNLKKNYASEKILMNNAQAQPYQTSNQKFEKTASVKTKSNEFEKDEALIMSKTKSFNAVIQYEQNLGQKGNRQLYLLIGVSPNLFDSFYVEVQKIGNVKELEITKVDKTTEYKQLNAKKASIENTLKSLNDLKSKAGQISDFVSLNDKILEVQEKLQELGVELGSFDAENEFCTVKFSLYEGASGKGISFIQRLKVAIEWTIEYYAIIVFTMLGLSVTIFVMLLIVDKLKIINSVTEKLKE